MVINSCRILITQLYLMSLSMMLLNSIVQKVKIY
nr:MAG TPA: hypothetical protein [Caudoviricetes sp.]